MVSSLHVAAEIRPMADQTGVGAAVSGLTAALIRQGNVTRVLLPGLPEILEQLSEVRPVFQMADLLGQGPVSLSAAEVRGVECEAYVLQSKALYEREGDAYSQPDGATWPDNWLRFGALGLVAAGLAQGADPDWSPEILHLHGWPAGLAASYIRMNDEPAAAIVTTIHNLDNQGLFAASRLGALGLPEAVMAPDGAEYHHYLSFLKSGVAYADWVTTVSSTYAEELQTPEFGVGLDGLFRHRARNLTGIVNGLDDFAPGHVLNGEDRKRAKSDMLTELGLSPEGEGPLMVMVGDVTPRAGADLVALALPEMLARDVRFCLSGNGDPTLEDMFRELAAAYGDRVAVRIGTDGDLERRLFAAADLVLVPSRVEPCGQAQLRGLKYGTVPLVRRTGGLADTVVNAEPNHLNAGRATGFMFSDPTPSALLGTLHWACDTWHDQFTWQRLREAGMQQDFTWARAALLYSRIYDRAVRERPALVS